MMTLRFQLLFLACAKMLLVNTRLLLQLYALNFVFYSQSSSPTEGVSGPFNATWSEEELHH